MQSALAIKLIKTRARLGLSQSQAAREWGVPVATLQSWEQGRRTPRGFALQALNEKLDKLSKSSG